MPPYVRAPFDSRLLEVANTLSSHVSTQGVRKAAHKRSAKVTKTNFTRSSLAYGRLLLSGSSEQPLECWRVSVRRGAVTGRALPFCANCQQSRNSDNITTTTTFSLSLSLPSHSFNVLNDDDGWSCCYCCCRLVGWLLPCSWRNWRPNILLASVLAPLVSYSFGVVCSLVIYLDLSVVLRVPLEMKVKTNAGSYFYFKPQERVPNGECAKLHWHFVLNLLFFFFCLNVWFHISFNQIF